jgi:hypothetical protein
MRPIDPRKKRSLVYDVLHPQRRDDGGAELDRLAKQHLELQNIKQPTAEQYVAALEEAQKCRARRAWPTSRKDSEEVNLSGIEQAKESTMTTSFSESEVLHAQALGLLADEGKLDQHTASEYELALERAALLYSETFAKANPSAAAAERRRLERRLEVERSRS